MYRFLNLTDFLFGVLNQSSTCISCVFISCIFRLQIVTDEDQNQKEMEIRISSDDYTTADDFTENQDISEKKGVIFFNIC